MKVYNWKVLLATIFLGGGGLVRAIFRLEKDNWRGLAWIAIFLFFIVQGLSASLTEAGFRRDQENEGKSKRAYAKFGKWAPVMPYGALILFLIAAFLLVVCSAPAWLGMCFVFAAPVYQIWLVVTVRKELKRTEQE